MTKEFMRQVRKHRSLNQVQVTVNRPGTVAVEVKEDGQWRTTLHPSEAAAEWFIQHTEHETRRINR